MPMCQEKYTKALAKQTWLTAFVFAGVHGYYVNFGQEGIIFTFLIFLLFSSSLSTVVRLLVEFCENASLSSIHTPNHTQKARR